MKQKSTLPLLASLALLGAPAQATATIGVNFTGGNLVASTDNPGIIAGANWNNIDGSSGSGIVLNDDTATATTATLTFSSAGSYWGFTAPSTPNPGTNTMYSGGIYGADSTNNLSFTVSNIPYAKYDIYVFGSQDTSDTTTLSVTNGTTTYYYKSAGTANGAATSLLETTSTDSNDPTVGPAQYQVFRGLTSPSVTITQGGSTQFVLSNNLFGFHIVAVTDGITIPYATWASANGVAGGADEDSDNDGVDNGVEYFMGITSSDPAFTANPGLDSSNAISWPMSATFSGNYEVETSPDLSTWTPVSPKPVPSGGFLNYTLPAGAPGGKSFVRLVVVPD